MHYLIIGFARDSSLYKRVSFSGKWQGDTSSWRKGSGIFSRHLWRFYLMYTRPGNLFWGAVRIWEMGWLLDLKDFDMRDYHFLGNGKETLFQLEGSGIFSRHLWRFYLTYTRPVNLFWEGIRIWEMVWLDLKDFNIRDYQSLSLLENITKQLIHYWIN